MMSSLAFVYLAEKKNTFPVTRVSFDDADHIFVVIGTGVNFRNDWHTWDSETAAICDPWADFAGLCTPMALQTWMEKLAKIMPLPFKPKDRFREGYGVASQALWKYSIMPP